MRGNIIKSERTKKKNFFQCIHCYLLLFFFFYRLIPPWNIEWYIAQGLRPPQEVLPSLLHSLLRD